MRRLYWRKRSKYVINFVILDFEECKHGIVIVVLGRVLRCVCHMSRSSNTSNSAPNERVEVREAFHGFCGLTCAVVIFADVGCTNSRKPLTLTGVTILGRVGMMWSGIE